MLRAENLSFLAGRRSLVSSVDFAVTAGEVVALLGPNGAGKSTLLKLLSAQIRPASGRVLFEGRALADWPPKELAKKRAVLPQSSTVPFDFTALEIVLLGRLPHGDGHFRTEEARAAMALTESLHLEDRIVTTLSGGEMQRVQLARVLLQIGPGPGPRCLMLDEPISNLDPAHQHGALQIVRDLARSGAGVLVVLHDLNLAAQYADRIVLMQEGRIVAQGSPDTVLTESRIEEVFSVRAALGRNPLCDAPAVFVGLRADRD